MRKFLLALALAFAPALALAQGAALVAPSPTPTTGHCVQWTNGNTISDSGGPCVSGGGTVTSVTAGTDLTGGTITTTGTIGLSSNVPRKNTANTFSSLQSLSGGATISAPFSAPAFGTTTSGLVPSPGTVTGKFLGDNGTWQTAAGAGTVTAVTAGAGLTGGTITGSGTLGLNADVVRTTQFNNITAGLAAATPGTRLQFSPTDYGVGKPALFLGHQTASPNTWDFSIYDGVTETGTINFRASNLTWNGLPIATTGGGASLSGATIYDVVNTYGGDPSGAADNVAAFNLAKNACDAGGGGVIYFRAGTFKFNSAITNNANGCSIHGLGPLATKFLVNFAGNFLTSTVYQVDIGNFQIYSAGAMTSGYALVVNGGSYTTVHDIYFNAVYNGGYLSNAGETVWSNILIVNNTGIVGLECNGASGAVYAVRYNHVIMDSGANSTTVGLRQANACNSLDVQQSFFGSTGTCMSVDVGSYFTTTEQLACDHNYEGLYINGGGGIQISNSWFGSQLNGRGITFTANFGGVAYIVNTSIRCNYYDGVAVFGGLDITMSNNSIGCNSQAASGTYHGIAIAAGVKNFTITGNRIGAIYPQTTPASQGYCVFINAGASDHYIVANNNCQGQVSGAVLDGGTGVNKLVTGNIQ